MPSTRRSFSTRIWVQRRVHPARSGQRTTGWADLSHFLRDVVEGVQGVYSKVHCVLLAELRVLRQGISDEPDALWSAVLRRQGGPFALLATMPPDPSLN